MRRSAAEIQPLRTRLSSSLDAMGPVELRHAERVIDVIRRTGTASEAMQGPVFEASIAKFVATTWPQLLVDAIFAIEKWERDELLKVLHHVIRHAQDDLEPGDDEQLALDVMGVAASFLHTGVEARGEIVRRGDAQTRRRLLLAHEALFGKTDDAKGIRAVVGIIKEDRDPAFVLRRLHRLAPGFKRLDRLWLKELLSSYSPMRPKKGSGRRTLAKIVALILIEVGVFGVKARRPDESVAALKTRAEDVRRRVESATKRG